MIGVIADPADAVVVGEFFELFKTPWEIYQSSRTYRTVIDATGSNVDPVAELVVRYGSHRIPTDAGRSVVELPPKAGGRLVEIGDRLPLYGRWASFDGAVPEAGLPHSEARALGYAHRKGAATEVRLGYDLFDEVRTLLTHGQPEQFAEIPTLELHIDLLRRWMKQSGAGCEEIPPVPDGYRFIAALTHDVDHPSLQRHGFDHTVGGFVARALFGSARDVCRRRNSLGELLRNWSAVLRLPLVQLGLARDFWLDFTRYPEWEKGYSSTFFVIPFAGQPGSKGSQPAPAFRAAAYAAADIAAQLRELREQGSEIGLHGLDAWCSRHAAEREREAVAAAAVPRPAGVRMHWLYFDRGSPELLDRAGFDYDSSVGYNGTVGFRAGTGQAFRPLGCERLLELPLIVMDTALFYSSHLNLSRMEAWDRVMNMLDHAERFGGCVTVNWHDRSISPERQWGGFYRDLVAELERRGAWITSAGEAVEWFRWRRGTEPGTSPRLEMRRAQGEAIGTPFLEAR